MTEVPASLKNINLNRVLRKQGWIAKQAEWKTIHDAAIPMARKYVESRRKKAEPQRHHQFSNDLVMGYWEKQIHIVEVLEDRFDNKVQQFIGKVVDGFLKHLEQEIAVNKSLAKTKDYFDDNEDNLLAQAQLDFTPLLSDVATLSGQEAMKLVGSSDVYTAERMRKLISDNVHKFTQSMLDTDRETLVNVINDGLTAGRSIPEIRGTIIETFDSIQKTQAQRITRTEVLRASNQGAVDAYKESGVVEGLQWLTAGAVDECADYDGQVIELDGSFYGSDNEFQDGNPPLHPNCRCVVLPVLIGEKGYTTQINKAAVERIRELESQIDKRTKEYREIKESNLDNEIKIARLQAVVDEQSKSMLNKDREGKDEQNN
jgi:SPP1 gp7 family putative phage head morphogenesis protein